MNQPAIPLLHDYLENSARRLPEKIALVCQSQRLTYRQIDEGANALAQTLWKHGVKRGDRVVILGENSVTTVIAFWAVLKANAVVCVVSPLTKSDKLSYLLQDARPSAFITEFHLRPSFVDAVASCPHLRLVVESAPPSPSVAEGEVALLPCESMWLHEALEGGRADAPPKRRCIECDLASIIYTSGSTGEPKGVMLTHRAMLSAATSISTYLENTQDDCILGVLPLAFDYGLYQMIMAFRVGARLVLERSFLYPAQVLKLIADEAVTGFPGVPTMFSLLAELRSAHAHDFSSIRYVTNTAAALAGKHITVLKTLFPHAKIFSMYGLTECKRCTYLPPDDLERKPTSVGIAIPNTELWLVDECDNRLGPGAVGELVIRGPTLMAGYWEKPEATARKLRPGPLPGERVLYTGDLCKLDEEGYLYFVGRMDDVIKSRGEKVAPKEVENVLYDIDGVREAAVVGVADPILGTAVKAFVVLEEGIQLDAKSIQKICHTRLEPFMVPKFIEFRPCLPRTDTGKIKKTGLS